MQRKCRTPGRNFCAPGGKIAALFVDVDGTLVKCQKNFDSAKKRFSLLMNRLGFDGEAVRKRAQEIELRFLDKHGFEREALATSFIKAYRLTCKEKGVKVEWDIVENCRDIGDSPFFREPELFVDASPVLNRAQHNFFIIAVTIGDREAQNYKVKKAGLRTIFDHIIVTGQDNKSQKVQNAISDLEIDPRYSLFIGNSARSDGQCLSNTNFLHLPLEGWQFDHAELPVNTGFETFEAKSWREAEENGINRLLLRRQVALEKEEEDHRSRCGHCGHDKVRARALQAEVLPAPQSTEPLPLRKKASKPRSARKTV
jgi:FMN phosphatase YigB (HAD superfamily)